MALPGVIGALGLARGADAALSLTSLNVSSGTEAGGTIVIGSGTGLTGATGVDLLLGDGHGGTWATRACTSVSSTSGTVTFTTPAGTLNIAGSGVVGTVCGVKVTTPLGTSTLAAAYTYTSELARLGCTSEGRAAAQDITLVGGTAASLVPCMNANGSGYAQASGTKQPAYNATGWASGPSLLFDGSNDYLINAFGTAVAAGKRPSLMLVFARVAGGGTRYICEASGNPENATYLLPWHDTVWKAYRGDSSGSEIISSAVSVNTSLHVVEEHFTSDGVSAFVLDGTAYNGSKTGSVVAGNTITSFAIGGLVNGAAPSNIHALHWVFWADGVSGADRTAARAALNAALYDGPGYSGAGAGKY